MMNRSRLFADIGAAGESTVEDLPDLAAIDDYDLDMWQLTATTFEPNPNLSDDEVEQFDDWIRAATLILVLLRSRDGQRRATHRHGIWQICHITTWHDSCGSRVI